MLRASGVKPEAFAKSIVCRESLAAKVSEYVDGFTTVLRWNVGVLELCNSSKAVSEVDSIMLPLGGVSCTERRCSGLSGETRLWF